MDALSGAAALPLVGLASSRHQHPSEKPLQSLLPPHLPTTTAQTRTTTVFGLLGVAPTGGLLLVVFRFFVLFYFNFFFFFFLSIYLQFPTFPSPAFICQGGAQLRARCGHCSAVSAWTEGEEVNRVKTPSCLLCFGGFRF